MLHPCDAQKLCFHDHIKYQIFKVIKLVILKQIQSF